MNRLKKILSGILEGSLTVVLVLASFLVFLSIMDAVFPSGTGFGKLISRQGPVAASLSVRPGWQQLLTAHGDQVSDMSGSPKLAAAVDRIYNTLKSKRADALSWNTARVGMSLYDRDAVQTLGRSGATIRFNENNVLQMGEQTLVIIKRMEEDLFFQDNRTFLVLMEGELRGKVMESDRQPTYVNVATPGANVRMRTADQADGQAEFKIAINPDQSSTISVYHGAVEVTGQDQKVVVEANRWTRVGLNQPPSSLQPLPDPVRLSAPADASTHFDNGRSFQVRLAWQGHTAATSYRIILARDPLFVDIVTDERVLTPWFTAAALTPGSYFWRVSALREGSEGRVSAARRFRVIRDLKPPVLIADTPPSMVYYRRLPPKIQYRWKRRPGVQGYRFVLARDEAFADIVTEKRLSKRRFAQKDLTAGTYFWRVAAVYDGGQEIFSKSRKFQVIQDQTPPVLNVDFPPETLAPSDFNLHGQTEPGVQVFVGGQAVDVSPSGQFHYTLRLQPGVNVIAVAAVDKANNVASRSQIVKCNN